MSLGAGLSVKVDTNSLVILDSAESSTLQNTLQEKDNELNLRDLDSSDEDMSAGPSGGCTGEP